MKLDRNSAERRAKNCVRVVGFSTLALVLFVPWAVAQTKDPGPAEAKSPQTYQTFYLSSPAQQRDALDIVTDLRNLLPRAKIYYVPSQGAISMLGTSDDFLLAKQILSDIDRARKTYRLTYTITETDSGQPAATRHVALIAATGGEPAELKQGSRVPVITGADQAGTSTPATQVQYVDVGLKIKASLYGSPGGLKLRTTVEQSSVAEEKSGMGAQDPLIHQTTLDETSTLVQGKPLVLGSLDVPGSTRHMEIEVSSEPMQ